MRRPAPALAACALALAIGTCGPRDVQSPEALVGAWQGRAAWRDATLAIDLDITRRGDSLAIAFSSPELLVSGISAGVLEYDAPRIRFTLPIGGEPWRFEGWLRRGLLVGSLTSPSAPPALSRSLRPQLTLHRLPRAAPAYAVRTWPAQGAPGGSWPVEYDPDPIGAHPAVVLAPLADSATARGIADLLARDGFVVIRLPAPARPDPDAAPLQALSARLESLRQARRRLVAHPGVDSTQISVWLIGRDAQLSAAYGSSAVPGAVSPDEWRILEVPHDLRGSDAAGGPAPAARRPSRVFPRPAAGTGDSLIAFARRQAGLPPRPAPLVPQGR